MQELADTLADMFEAVSPGDTAAVEALRPYYHPAIRFTDPLQHTEGLEAFLEANRRLVARTRVLSFTMHERVGSGDHVFLTWTMRLAMRIGPTLQEEGVTHLRCEGGKVIEHRDFWDIAALVTSVLPGGPRLLRAAFKPFV